MQWESVGASSEFVDIHPRSMQSLRYSFRGPLDESIGNDKVDDQRNKQAHRPWTAVEESFLLSCKTTPGNKMSWEDIAELMGNGRTKRSLASMWSKMKGRLPPGEEY